ncbi:hypothetical protein [Aeromonas phage Akh-2]|nr:hypothetical protein [Aeromonas phage Akh-2]
MSEQKPFNKEELVWALEIMYSLKVGTSEFAKCTVAFLEKLYYGNLQNGMRTNELATREAEQVTKILELEAEVKSLKGKLAKANRDLRRSGGRK